MVLPSACGTWYSFVNYIISSAEIKFLYGPSSSPCNTKNIQVLENVVAKASKLHRFTISFPQVEQPIVDLNIRNFSDTKYIKGSSFGHGFLHVVMH